MALSKIKIKITSSIKNEGEASPERTSEEALGIMHTDAGGEVKRITYKTSAEGVITETVIELYGTAVRLIRSGAVESNIVFEAGTTHPSLYKIPPYAFDMSVATERLESSLSKDGGELLLLYKMQLGGMEKACKMQISIHPC